MVSDVAPRLASTVMLLRKAPPAADGGCIEVFVLHRVAAMVFAPSVTVFPGGGVDSFDGEEIAWAGPDVQWWATALATDPVVAKTVVVAAVRELFEETGVLLADGPATEDDRRAVAEHRLNLSQVFSARGLTVQSDMLRPWANWITPQGSPRRYDTFFFVATQPQGQNAEMLTSEAESGRWARPSDLLAEHSTGAVAMMPPTLAMLMDLDRAQSVDQAMSQRREIVPLLPTVRSKPGEPLEVEVQGRVYSMRIGGDR